MLTFDVTARFMMLVNAVPIQTWIQFGSVYGTTEVMKFEIRHPISATASEASVILVTAPVR